MFSVVSKRFYTVSTRRLAEAAASPTATAALSINFCTPHAPIYSNKVVNMIMLPGEIGEYGVTAGHAPLISQLKPGVVSIVHSGGETEKFFVPGGFALTHANSKTDVSVPEAYPLSAFDEASVKAAFAEATKNAASENPAVKAAAQIEINVYTALGRALGLTL